MTDYISREALIALARPGAFATSCDGAVRQEDAVPVRVIQGVPAANTVEVRHGRWLSKEYYSGACLDDMWIARLAKQSDYYAYCSICGKDAEYNAEGSLILSDYCPHCGAKMTGGVEEEE